MILDDWGLEPLDAAARHDLLEILEERYGRRSTVITSQLPVDRWHEVIGDPTYADAILENALVRAVDAESTVTEGQINQAIGAALGIETMLEEARALFGAALALHRGGRP